MVLERSLRNPLVKSKVSKRSISKIEEKTDFFRRKNFKELGEATWSSLWGILYGWPKLCRKKRLWLISNGIGKGKMLILAWLIQNEAFSLLLALLTVFLHHMLFLLTMPYKNLSESRSTLVFSSGNSNKPFCLLSWNLLSNPLIILVACFCNHSNFFTSLWTVVTNSEHSIL